MERGTENRPFHRNVTLKSVSLSLVVRNAQKEF